jgi:hypothetical protein
MHHAANRGVGKARMFGKPLEWWQKAANRRDEIARRPANF